MHRRWPRLLAATALLSVIVAPATRAQASLPLLDDATLAPRGTFRLRAISAWTRFDSRFTGNGTEPLGASFTADSLGTARIPTLDPNERAIQSASGSPFTLSLGRSRLDARGREEIVPIGLEYGITSRLSVGVLVPVIRRRIAVQFRLDSAGANVGPNLQRSIAAAQVTNAQVQSQFASAKSQLQARLAFCQSNPGSTGCATLLSRQAEASQLISQSQGFADTLASLYGSSTSTGMPFVPLAASPAQTAVNARVSDFNTRYRDLLGASSDLLLARPVGAVGPAGSADLQDYLHDELGRDSIATQERSGVGDVEVGVKALVLDLPATEGRTMGLQLAVSAAARLPTGSRDSPSEIADLTTGGGTPGVDARAALDARIGRFGLLVVGGGVFATGTAAEGRDSRVMGLQVAPRWHVSAPMSFHAAYSFQTGDAGSATQLVGGGVTVSTLDTYRASGGPLPLEMRFTHLEAISGPASSPKFFRDQIEFRVYYRWLKR